MKTKGKGSKVAELTADERKFHKTIKKLCSGKYDELAGKRTQFALADRLVVCAPLAAAVKKKGMKFAVLHFDHLTCDWIQYFKNARDTLSVAVWFAQIHGLPIAQCDLSDEQWSAIKVAIQNAKKTVQRFKLIKKAALKKAA